MWSLELIVGITLMSAACVLLVAITLVRVFERSRHRRIINSHVTLGRGLSTYHRANLSLDGTNYSHVQRPSAGLRNRPPVLSDHGDSNWAPLGSTGQITSEPPLDTERSLETNPKRKRSLRLTLHSHSIHDPKTRRQKNIERMIPLNGMSRSPLSAITELTDSTPSEPSPAITYAELPADEICQIQPKARPTSLQWPIPVAKRRPHEVLAVAKSPVAARDSVLLRANRQNVAIRSRGALGSRSLSMASYASLAPDDPLPPLPTVKLPKYLTTQDRARLSTISLDTVDSSVLDTAMNSPSRIEKEAISVQATTPIIKLDSPSLNEFSGIRGSWGPSVVTAGSPVARVPKRSLSRKMQHPDSFRASVAYNYKYKMNNEGYPLTSLGKIDSMRDCSGTTGWCHAVTSENEPIQPLQRLLSVRHSMFAGPGQYSNNKQMVYFDSGPNNSLGIHLTPRPASAASGQIFEFDRSKDSVQSHFSLHNTSESKKGHKRQNCVRISNLLQPEPLRTGRRLPQMLEEEDLRETPLTRRINIPCLSSVKTGEPALRVRASPMDVKPSPPPFQNRPILESSGRRAHPSYHRMSSNRAAEISRPDSDVFSSSKSDPLTPTNFASLRYWPLSPKSKGSIKLNSTPQITGVVEGTYIPDSPMLPSLEVSSATLFPRKSAVRGPRHLPVSGQCSPTASPEPVGGRNGRKRPGNEIGRSAMLLRRMTSEGKLLDQGSRIYRNVGEENSSCYFTLNKLATPTTNHMNLIRKATRDPTGHFVTHCTGRGSEFGVSGSKVSMAYSPSCLSVWEDESIGGDSSEPETPVGSNVNQGSESEARKNGMYNKGGQWAGKFTSPQGKGLGITNAGFGTPGSFYDSDGFLKEV